MKSTFDETYLTNLIANGNLLNALEELRRALPDSTYFVEVRSKNCLSTTTKVAYAVETNTDNLVVPCACKITKSTVVLKTSERFTNPIVRIDGRLFKPLSISKDGRSIKIPYPTGQDNTVRTIVVKDNDHECRLKTALNKDITATAWTCKTIPHPETYEVTFALGGDLQAYKEYIKVFLDNKEKDPAKPEYRIEKNKIIMNVYGNIDTDGDKLNEPREIEIKILLPDKKLIEICSFRGALQKSVTLKCNDWAIAIKTKKKLI